MSASPPQLIIVVPYRDRAHNLATFVPELNSYLRDVPHKIVVIEQTGDELFNKGRLMNAGFHLHRHENAYFCFHDVDLLPENRDCDYSLPVRPLHLSVRCQQLGYRWPYEWLCGGVMLFQKQHFTAVNGYSNEYWGWGAEDDDMGFRLQFYGFGVDRSRPGRYSSLPHARSSGQGKGTAIHQRNLIRLRSGYDYEADGLRNLAYNLVGVSERAGYTHFQVDIGMPPDDLRQALLEPFDQGDTSSRGSAYRAARHRQVARPGLPGAGGEAAPFRDAAGGPPAPESQADAFRYAPRDARAPLRLRPQPGMLHFRSRRGR